MFSLTSCENDILWLTKHFVQVPMSVTVNLSLKSFIRNRSNSKKRRQLREHFGHLHELFLYDPPVSYIPGTVGGAFRTFSSFIRIITTAFLVKPIKSQVIVMRCSALRIKILPEEFIGVAATCRKGSGRQDDRSVRYSAWGNRNTEHQVGIGNRSGRNRNTDIRQGLGTGVQNIR